ERGGVGVAGRGEAAGDPPDSAGLAGGAARRAVAAEGDEPLGARREPPVQVEAAGPAPRALPLGLAAGDEDDGSVVPLDESRGDDPDHALVPFLARENVAVPASLRFGP